MSGTRDAVIARVDSVLAAFLDSRVGELAALGEDVVPLADAARTIVLDGGKRLRPVFAYWGWRTVRAEDDDDRALIAAAASLELLHTCALVHDDVMDDSETRRGRPAAHAAFAVLHRLSGWVGDPRSFGSAAAIILGDLLLSWADALFASADIEPAYLAGTREVFDSMRQLVMVGQYLDVLVQARAAFSSEEALRVIELKTSKYTVEGPLHLGAAIGGADPALRAVLSDFGLPLGEAFQLRDDVLGVFGDPARTGKPAGDDLRGGKQTLLTALAMRAATRSQTALLRDFIGDRTLDADQVAEVRTVIVATGALAEVETRIAAGAAQALTALESPAIPADVRAALSGLAAAAAQRDT